MLFQKHIFTKYNWRLSLAKSCLNEQFRSFYDLEPPGEFSAERVRDWKAFLDSAPKEMDHYYYGLGAIREGGVRPEMERAFKRWLQKAYDNDLEKMNADLGTKLQSWEGITVVPEDFTVRRATGDYRGILARFQEFKENISPKRWHYYFSMDGAFREKLQRKYKGKIEGESFPQIWLNLGPGVVAAYLSDFLYFDGDTAWFELPPSLKWDEILNLKFDPDNGWWQLTKKLASSLAAAAKGKFVVGMTDLGGVTDILASLRGSENLLIDLIEHPAEVKEASNLLVELWFRYYQELRQIIKATADDGSSGWMGIWSPGCSFPIQCDFSTMISPDMFAEFVLPSLQEQCRRLDHTIYHWDGPGQIPHLEHLLSIRELDGIQWTPGAGASGAESSDWFPLYKKIQDAGKLLVLLDVPSEKIGSFIKEVPPAGLFIRTTCDSEAEANELLDSLVENVSSKNGVGSW